MYIFDHIDGVDFKKHPLYNTKFAPLSSFPANPKVGLTVYFNGITHDGPGIYYFEGTNWIKTGPSGPITWNQKNHIEVTYDELVNTHWGFLEPGLYYIITDFQTAYNSQLAPIEPIMVLAIDTNKISTTAYSLAYPEDEIKYDIFTADPKGKIIFRRDAIKNISTYYDWRNVKFRRWNRGTELAGNYTSWTDTGNAYEDYYTFDTSDGINFSNITIGKAQVDNNIIFKTNAYDVIIGENSINCTFGENFYYNTIGRGFSNNSIGKNAFRNKIDDDFHDNLIGDDFQRNTIGYLFYNNQIQINFKKNVIGNDVHDNTMNDNFENNILGDEVYGNTFGKNFTYNEIADRFQNNIFAINSNHNKFLLDSIQSVNFGTKANRRLDIGYSDIEIIKSITGTVLDITNEWWAGRIYISTDGANIDTILFIQYSHPIDIIPMLGIDIKLIGTSVINGLNGDILMPTVDLDLKGDTGDRVTLLKDALGRFRQVTGIDYR